MEIDDVKRICDDICDKAQDKLGTEVVRRTFAHEAREGALYFPSAMKADSRKAKTLVGVLTKVFGNCSVEMDSKFKEISFQFTWAATPAPAG